MNMTDRWSVNLNITETDGRTHAEARLAVPTGEELVGCGDARRNPADREVTLIGEQIAASRALSDLAGQLLHAAAAGIEDITHERAHLQLLSAAGTSGPRCGAMSLRRHCPDQAGLIENARLATRGRGLGPALLSARLPCQPRR